VTTSTRSARALAVACGLSIGAAAPAAAVSDPTVPPAIEPAAIGLLGRLLPAAPHARPAHHVRSRHARLTRAGHAIAPAGAPRRVRQIIRAGNRIATTPYVWGGGHGSWHAAGYDCSGSVGYALHGARLLQAATTSGALASYGRSGRGRWVTIYANGGHVYMVVAGLRFDTSAHGAHGSRWTHALRDAGGYVVRHPAGL
jgi:cell wall-associated NlpC family hydrolase